ncbi:DUF7159 family protein [Mycolicibacterium arenosum]|uniref:DUF7159 domain-containing protein n=1 Tax=Mycolicibacterium arenosum TaxID=2952157 RepID=A0ABT1M7B5_9MYCO|nr:hypothetical protein [Mycolicibacterium sp. CAU 1645]MCP9275065.1 hypothetical protein [Mycolicibacterium sp. CAU 1645]
MDAVLGLSMTPTSVGLVLVEGHEADGATMDRDAFEVRTGARHTSEQAAEAVRRTEAQAADRGVRLHSIGVTWSEDADDQASALMRSLSESGFDNVVAIRMPEATEALARGIADVIGYQTTAVCVIEPDTVIALVVHAGEGGAVQTVVNHAIDTDASLISWLSSVFAKADWQPEALVVVGSAGGFDEFIPLLEDALSVPVFSPEEAELALARGAALASTSTLDVSFDDFAVAPREPAQRRSVADRRLSPQTGAVALLVAGVVTFVVSVSVAVSLQFSPREEPAGVSPAGAVAEPPVARPSPPAAPPRAVSTPPAAPVLPSPPPEAPPLPVAPPPVVEAAPVDPVLPEAPVEPPYVESPEIAPVDGAPLPGPAAVPQQSAAVAPPVVIPVQPPKKPLHTRILDRLRGIGQPDPEDYAPIVPPPGTPPPG